MPVASTLTASRQMGRQFLEAQEGCRWIGPDKVSAGRERHLPGRFPQTPAKAVAHHRVAYPLADSERQNRGTVRRVLGARNGQWPRACCSWRAGASRKRAVASLFTSNCQAVPALQAARFEDGPSGSGRHAVAEPMPPRPPAIVGLERTFHSLPPR